MVLILVPRAAWPSEPLETGHGPRARSPAAKRAKRLWGRDGAKKGSRENCKVLK